MLILPKWWQNITQEELTRYLTTPVPPPAEEKTKSISRRSLDVEFAFYRRDRTILSNIDELNKWPDKQPEVISDTERIIAMPNAAHVLICSKGFAVREVAVKGMVGLVDIGDVELNTSRSSTIKWDVEEFRNRVIEMLSPQIISALDALMKEPNIPSRFEFLADVCEAYGYEIITNTELKWISIIKPPGDAILISPDELRKNISEAKEILLIYGGKSDPWNSYSICRKRFSEASDDAIIIPISSDG
ncbi:MAG TPA: hypothetical protein G4O10_07890 [Dehalococcoidia bacterium]|nr:hypothetical protein [Dehalococcoidia bacterium]